MLGDAWKNSRTLLTKNYSDLVLVSIAAASDADMSFSADTGMGECLVVGRKSSTGSQRAVFVILAERPAYPLLRANMAEQIRRLIEGKSLQKLEDGRLGGTPLTFGNQIVGQALDVPLPAPAGGWNLSRIADIYLAQTAYQLTAQKRVWLPTMNEQEATRIPVSTIGAIGKIGPLHLDVEYDAASPGGLRGPFDISPVTVGTAPTYPVLWKHTAERERTMSFDAESEGTPHLGKTPKERAELPPRCRRYGALPLTAISTVTFASTVNPQECSLHLAKQ